MNTYSNVKQVKTKGIMYFLHVRNSSPSISCISCYDLYYGTAPSKHDTALRWGLIIKQGKMYDIVGVNILVSVTQ